MEKNNLDVAPTEQELINAGFFKAGASNHSNYGKLIKRINNELFVMFGGKKCSLCFDYGHVNTTIKEIEPTKAAINAEFKHFNQPLPKWEKPKPKVGEVWKSSISDYLVIKESTDDEPLKGFILDSKTKEYINSNYSAIPTKHNKLADTLDDYYKEKFNKNNPLSELDKQIEEHRNW